MKNDNEAHDQSIAEISDLYKLVLDLSFKFSFISKSEVIELLKLYEIRKANLILNETVKMAMELYLKDLNSQVNHSTPTNPFNK